MRLPLAVSAAILASISIIPCAVCAGNLQSDRTPILLEVQLNSTARLSRLKPSDRLEGKVKRDVYSGERKLIPSGSPIELTVTTVERHRQKRSDRWPWVVRRFAPRHSSSPCSLAGVVALPNGSKVSIPLTLVSISHAVKLTTRAKEAASVEVTGEQSVATVAHQAGSGAHPGLTLLLKAERPPVNGVPPPAAYDVFPPPMPQTLAAGTVARVVLLRDLRASASHTGDAFQARLCEPVYVNSRLVLPEGVLIQGEVVRSIAPRWRSRSGFLSLTFTRLKLPAGETAIVASPSGVVVDRTAGLRMNSEGGLRASPGTARLLIDLGVTGGLSKVADDSFQLIAEALISTATDASTAGTAKIVAAAASGIYLLTRHGRDVVLPQYTNMEITFGRPVLLQPNAQGQNRLRAEAGPIK